MARGKKLTEEEVVEVTRLLTKLDVEMVAWVRSNQIFNIFKKILFFQKIILSNLFSRVSNMFASNFYFQFCIFSDYETE